MIVVTIRITGRAQRKSFALIISPASGQGPFQVANRLAVQLQAEAILVADLGLQVAQLPTYQVQHRTLHTERVLEGNGGGGRVQKAKKSSVRIVRIGLWNDRILLTDGSSVGAQIPNVILAIPHTMDQVPVGQRRILSDDPLAYGVICTGSQDVTDGSVFTPNREITLAEGPGRE